MASVSGPRQVLELPELLESIFQFLASDLRSLAQAILVNRTWFECAIRVLWRDPPSEALTAIQDQHRLQLYASKVGTLAFNGPQSEFHERLKGVHFPSLKSISIDSYHPDDGKLYLRQYLHPSLEEFMFYGGPLDEDFLDFMVAACPHLRTILIDHPGRQISPQAFQDFLRRMQALEQMTFLYGVDGCLTDDLLIYLAGRENLKTLRINRPVKAELLELIRPSIPVPFRHMNNLRLQITSDAVPVLVEMVNPRLGELFLTITGEPDGVMEHVSKLSELYALNLVFESTTPLEKEDLMALKKLHNLRRFAIGGPGSQADPSLVNFTDNDFHELVSNLPYLRSLNLEVQCDLSTKILQSLSKHCRHLETCTLLPVFDLQQLELNAEQDLFPALVDLEIGGIQGPADPVEIAKLVQIIFPKLKDLDCNNGDEFSESVVDAFHDLAGE
ncbi:hypothetical protein BX600DRAFT_471131 [Xylariales sp. PMI_506]|nr:hypothetical protein BX600DRAFT_471131 [Xylariales sp. PMI_506]